MGISKAQSTKRMLQQTIVSALRPRVDTGPRPTVNDVPVHSPIVWRGEPTKHLIYHIWPNNKSNNWRWNVDQLIKRIALFDGVRSIGVVTGPDAANLAEVQAKFNGIRIDHWFEAPNQPLVGEPGNVMSDDGASALLGEGLTFLTLLHTLPRDKDNITFYGHARGSRYIEGDAYFELHRRWTQLLYKYCLDDPESVLYALKKQPMAGCFKRYGDFDLPRNWHWHYSGTFFWFRNADVFAHQSWTRLHPAMYGQVEAWPAGMFPASHTACLFGDDVDSLYEESEIVKWEIPQNGVSDKSFFDQEVERGFTTTLWPTMLNIHRVAAQTIKSLGCQSVFEIGSGLGAFLLGCQQEQLTHMGMDRNIYEREFAISKGVSSENYIIGDIKTFKFDRYYDCVNCVEVFEHLSDEELQPICQQLAASCNFFYFTSTPYADSSDKEWGHINIKSKNQWVEFFNSFGLSLFRDDKTIVDWGLIFTSQRVIY